MGNRLYVGDLSFSTSEQAIEAAFAAAGEVLDAPPGRALGDFGQEDLNRRLFQLEAVVQHYAGSAATIERIAHLAPALQHAADLIERARLTPREFRGIARAFLLVLDTLPVYDPFSSDDLAVAWELRRLAGAMVEERAIRSIRLIDVWALLRHQRQAGLISVSTTWASNFPS